MLIYYKDGWFEYRTFNGNIFVNSFAGIKAETKKRFNIDIMTLLN